MTWIATYTGKKFDVLHPRMDCIDIEDIATALSRIPRFAGHTNEFYSVAQHSVIAMRIISPPSLLLAALLHDASEAYLMDIPRPVKAELPDYARVEDLLMRAIACKFGFDYPLDQRVKEIDGDLLETERRDLMPHSPPWSRSYGTELKFTIKPWDSGYAKAQFLEAYQYALNETKREEGWG